MAKKKVMNECIEELVKAIILQAVEDYRNALMVLNWYQGQKQKEKARRIELRKIRKQAKKPGETPEQGEADAGQTSRPMKPMGKEARRKAERKRKQAGEKRRKREELVRAARRRKREVERFFHSSWFSMMSDTDPEKILREARAIEKDGAIPEGTGIPGAGTEGGQPGGEAGDAAGEPAGTGYGYGKPSERGDCRRESGRGQDRTHHGGDCGYGAADHGGEGRGGENPARGPGNGITDQGTHVPEGDHDALSGIPDTAGNRGRDLLQPDPDIPASGDRTRGDRKDAGQ